MQAQIRALGPSNIKMKFLPGLVGPQGPVGPPAQPVASQAEAEAGVASDKSMTPERTKQAIVALGGSASVTASGAGAVTRSVAGKLGDWISLFDFIPPNLHAGILLGTYTGDLSDYIQAAIDALPVWGGVIHAPNGLFCHAKTIQVGTGSGTGPNASARNNVLIVGAGNGSSSGIVRGCTEFRYTGLAGQQAWNWAGEITGGGMKHMKLSGGGAANVVLQLNAVQGATFEQLSIIYPQAGGIGLYLAPYGSVGNCGYNTFFNVDVVAQTVGSSAVYIAYNPALDGTQLHGASRNTFIRCDFYFDGSTANSHGLLLGYCDNNAFMECMTLAVATGASKLGYGLYFQGPIIGVPAGGSFPQEHAFYNCAFIGDVGGTSGEGGNIFLPYPTSDGQAVPAIEHVHGVDYAGRQYVDGMRSYRVRQMFIKDLAATASVATTTYTDVADLSVTFTPKNPLYGGKIEITLTAEVGKGTAGSGDVILYANGGTLPRTKRTTGSTPYAESIAVTYFIDPILGSNTIKVQIRSSDTNAFAMTRATLIVKELY